VKVEAPDIRSFVNSRKIETGWDYGVGRARALKGFL
jgi:hypothetical protein